MTAAHHDLCFGCGLANIFGLQLESRREPDGSLAGRFFVKQDHQGEPGVAHPGVIAAALHEALALALGEHPRHVVVEHRAPAPIGAFVEVTVRDRHARATGEQGPVADARALIDPPPSG
jgi:acyl-coenzyme A thioesterase PaaI-like protein